MLKGLQRFLSGNNRNNQKAEYHYVQIYRAPNRPSENDEIVEIRVDLANDLSLDDDGGYFSRKVVVGPKSFKQAELLLYYDMGRMLRNAEVANGKVATRADYEAYLASTEEA